MKVLLYGGTFDPPHNGHLNNLRAAAGRVRPDHVVVMPAGVPPHKAASTTPAALRLEMCRCFYALEGSPDIPSLTVSSWEIGRSRPTFEQIIEISNIFNTSTDYLLGKSDSENNYVYTDNKTLQNFYVDFGRLSKAEQNFIVKSVRAYVENK